MQLLETIIKKEIFKSCVVVLDEIFSQKKQVLFEIKKDGSLCSNTEKNIQRQIASLLQKETPDIKFVCEEQEQVQFYADEFAWYLDPIDGTISFKNNLNFFGVTLTLSRGVNPIASLVYFPRTKDVYISYLNQGTFKNGVSVPAISEYKEENFSVFCYSDLYTFDLSDRNEWLNLIKRTPYISRTYTDIFGYSLVVDGCSAGKFDAACAIWDMLPAFLLIKESGGTVIIYMHKKPTVENVCSMLVGSKNVVMKIDNMICNHMCFDNNYRFVDCIPDVKF